MVVFFIPIHYAWVVWLHDMAAEMFGCRPIDRANDLGQVVAPKLGSLSASADRLPSLLKNRDQAYVRPGRLPIAGLSLP